LENPASYRCAPPPEDISTQLRGVVFGIDRVADENWLSTPRKMVTALGWERRRDYKMLFDALEYLRQYRNIENFDIGMALSFIRKTANHFELLRPDTAQYFAGLWRGSPKAWSLGYRINVEAELFPIDRS
jgi:hypothetical protein